MLSISELVRSAIQSGFNFVRITPTFVSLQHRGHSGPRNHFSRTELQGDDFLKLSAEVRRLAVHEEESNVLAGARTPATMLSGVVIGESHYEGGHIVLDDMTLAYEFSIDSKGGEQIALSIGYTTFRMLNEWVTKKSELCLALASRVDRSLNEDADPLPQLWQTLDSTPNLEGFDLDEWAAQRHIALKPAIELPPPVPDEMFSAASLRREWRRLRHWTIIKGFFQSDDHARPESFFSRSDYAPLNRFAIETDEHLRTNFIIDRLDGKGFVHAYDAKFAIDCFITGDGASDHLEQDLLGFDDGQPSRRPPPWAIERYHGGSRTSHVGATIHRPRIRMRRRWP